MKGSNSKRREQNIRISMKVSAKSHTGGQGKDGGGEREVIIKVTSEV